MIQIQIPGFRNLDISNIVIDYNGTAAKDGIPLKGLKERLKDLSKDTDIHIITADTHGTVRQILRDYDCSVFVISGPDQALQKKNFIKKLNPETTIAIGNGFNDYLMLEQAALGIAVIMDEGCCTKTILNSDIVVKSINDGLDLIIKTKRLIAGLRNE